MAKTAAALLVAAILTVGALFYLEGHRHTCDKCGKALQPMKNFPEIYECPNKSCEFALDVASSSLFPTN